MPGVVQNFSIALLYIIVPGMVVQLKGILIAVDLGVSVSKELTILDHCSSPVPVTESTKKPSQSNNRLAQNSLSSPMLSDFEITMRLFRG